jgi:hypothetical protein
VRWLLVLLAGCDGVFGVHYVDPVIDAPPDAPPDAPSTYTSTILADHPVAYLPLDDDLHATTALDLVAGGPAGTILGLATPGGDPPFATAHHAYAFDGANGSVELPDLFGFEGNAPFSVEAWVNPVLSNIHHFHGITAKWRAQGTIDPPSGWNLYMYFVDDAPETPRFVFARIDAVGVGDSAEKTTSPGWHHVVGVYNGSAVTLYLDGQFVATKPSLRPLEHLALTIEIGAGNGNSHDQPMSGSIDEVAIYDYALGDLRIAAHYDARSL